MRYTAPVITAYHKALFSIRGTKGVPLMEGIDPLNIRSTSGAYESDE